MLKRVTLGVLTAVPLLYIMSFLFVLDRPGAKAEVLEILHTGVIALTIALLAFYVFDSFKNPNVPSEKRRLWTAVLVLGNIFVEPVYFWLYIWTPAKRLS
jgi:chromate transport protein ChrA